MRSTGPDSGAGAMSGAGSGASPDGPRGPRSGRPPRPDDPEEHDDSDLLAALLDGMDAALCAFDADGVITHWNREAERILGWSAEEAVGRKGFAGWAVRSADADDVQGRLFEAMRAKGRLVHEFALVTKDGGRVLVRTQSAGVRGADGRPAGVYCAFSEVHAQIDLERSIALSEALLEDAAWGVVLVDADLRPAVVNAHAARALGTARGAMLGRPLGDLLVHGVEELENALQHVLAEGGPPAPVDLWVTLRADADEHGEDEGEGPHRGASGSGTAGSGASGSGARSYGGSARGGTGGSGARRCWRSGFLRLASPLAEEPVPLGVGWFFQDVTEAKRLEQEGSLLRFRGHQAHRAGLAAAECENPLEAATVHLDFSLAGFADHALLDLLAEGEPLRLVRAAATPAGGSGPCSPVASGTIPVRYVEGHPALQAVERCGSVRAGAGRTEGAAARQWARARQWPEDTVHALCAVLRSRARTLGVVTFLRGPARRPFDRTDAAYAEDVALRVAAALDLAALVRR
ncbi:PAS domain-containing protein [Streptomyces sp. URMC 123]|uniref:PAS domain-containing protein n=1 Tax=Streptomyces sp. URMC 123 TaxID=3423403 RepID=UPI003F1CAA7E